MRLNGRETKVEWSNGLNGFTVNVKMLCLLFERVKGKHNDFSA